MPLDLPALHAAILADAQRRSQADPAQVRVASSDAVTWRDASLGCPEPGRMYTQRLVRGYRIRVIAAGTVLDYHASDSGQWLYCPAERAAEPLSDDSK